MNRPAPATTGRRNGVGWLGRNWAWFVPAGCLVLLLLFAALTGGILVLVMASIRHSGVYGEAVERARAHPAVVRELGAPVRTGWWILGNLHTSGSSGSADLTIPIYGPRDSAGIFAVAERRAGAWEFEYLVVEVDGSGKVFDLLGNGVDRIRTAGRVGVPPPPPPGRVIGREVLTVSGRFAKLDRFEHPGIIPVSNLRRGVS